MARELYRCTVCDDDIEKKGRYGHIKFSDGNGHGPKGEVPEDAEDYFIPVDEQAREDAKEQAEESDSGNGGDGSESSEQSEDLDDKEIPVETTDPPEDDPTLWEKLNTPIHELL